MAFSMKVHESDAQNEIIAACDSLLVGKVIKDAVREIEFKVSSDFYGNEEFEWEEIKDILLRGNNINIVGNEIVALAIKEGIIKPSNTIDIGGVKHAQIYAF